MPTLLLALTGMVALALAARLRHERLLAPLARAARDGDGLFVATVVSARAAAAFPVYAHPGTVRRMRSWWRDPRRRLVALEAFQPDHPLHQAAVRAARAALLAGNAAGLPLPPQGVLQMAELYIAHAGDPSEFEDVAGPSGTFIMRTLRAPGR